MFISNEIQTNKIVIDLSELIKNERDMISTHKVTQWHLFYTMTLDSYFFLGGLSS